MTPEFWQGRRVLLTGHTGFKGSWLALWLQHLGAQPVGYSLPAPTIPSLFELTSLAGTMPSIVADVRDLDRLAAAVHEHEPEIVIHMAAQPLVRQSYRLPIDTFSTNVLGTANLLEAVRHTPGVRAVVIVTTDKCYEDHKHARGYREDDPLGGYDPYSASKACAELVAGAYRSSFFNPARHPDHGVGVASARAGNVIGGGDWSADRLLPDVFRAIAAEQPVRLRNPAATRPWQHVLEPLAGYLMLAEALHDAGTRFAGAWNFGPDEQDVRSVSEVVQAVLMLAETDVAWEADRGTHPHETQYLGLDTTKARNELGWRPRLDLDAALGWTVEWMTSWKRGGDVAATSIGQIRRYMETPTG